MGQIDTGSWIGVFYTDSNDELHMVGGFNGWKTTSIAAWGSEAGMANGFASGEIFTFE